MELILEFSDYMILKNTYNYIFRDKISLKIFNYDSFIKHRFFGSKRTMDVKMV